MLKEEFEKLTGKKVTAETFAAWEAAYMTSDEEKHVFCRRVAPLVKGIKEATIYAYYIGMGGDVWRGEYGVNVSDGCYTIRNYEPCNIDDIPHGEKRVFYLDGKRDTIRDGVIFIRNY